MNSYPLYIDVHVLQTVPPSNINRDDTGSPKTARFGGVMRARVSSQAWKKATRDTLASFLDEEQLGQRTKYAAELIAKEIVATDNSVEYEKAEEMAAEILKATGIKLGKRDDSERLPTSYLLFISPSQIKGLANLALNSDGTDQKKSAKAILDIKTNPALNAVDIALFGRMVTDAPELSVDASVQVAHALGVSRSEAEFDYFTAMDDCASEDNAGAGMIGTVEFTSATFYRYTTVDVAHLFENLGSIDAAIEAGKAFVKAFITSMPTGKQNTFANRTLPSAVVVQLRNTQSMSLVNAFEVPVTAQDDKGQIELACEKMVKQEKLADDAFGVTPEKTFVVCAAPGTEALKELANGESSSLEELITGIGQAISEYLNLNIAER